MRKVLQGEREREKQEPTLLENQRASVYSWHHAKQDLNNCDSIACCGHREPRPSCPGCCKEGDYTGLPPAILLASCFLSGRKPSPVIGEDKNPTSLMNYGHE